MCLLASTAAQPTKSLYVKSFLHRLLQLSYHINSPSIDWAVPVTKRWYWAMEYPYKSSFHLCLADFLVFWTQRTEGLIDPCCLSTLNSFAPRAAHLKNFSSSIQQCHIPMNDSKRETYKSERTCPEHPSRAFIGGEFKSDSTRGFAQGRAAVHCARACNLEFDMFGPFSS